MKSQSFEFSLWIRLYPCKSVAGLISLALGFDSHLGIAANERKKAPAFRQHGVLAAFESMNQSNWSEWREEGSCN